MADDPREGGALPLYENFALQKGPLLYFCIANTMSPFLNFIETGDKNLTPEVFFYFLRQWDQLTIKDTANGLRRLV